MDPVPPHDDKSSKEQQNQNVSSESSAKLLEDNSEASRDSSEVSVERIPEEPVFDGTEKASEDVHDTDTEATSREFAEADRANHATFRVASAFDFATKGVDWPEKASAVKNFVKERTFVVSNIVRERGAVVSNAVKEQGVAVTNVIRRLSGKFEDSSTESPGYPKVSTSTKAESDGPIMKGRITLYSKSGCQDSRAARSILRNKGLKFLEINVDLFPHQRLELEQRTGTSSTPQVFFNESLVGGIDELNALEDKKELDARLVEVFENECPSLAPQPPVYGEDEPPSVKLDEFAEVVRKLREKVEVNDKFHKMRLFSRCFVASEAVEVLAEDQYCERDEAIEYGKKIAAKKFFSSVLQENLFEDGNHLYRFFEHDPVISEKCFNFSGFTNDREPLPAAEVEKMLRNFTHAIIDLYVSEDGKHVDYQSISLSEEYKRYLKVIEEFHRVDLSPLSGEEKLAFFINLYNMMIIHAIIVLGHPTGPMDRRRLFGDFQYVVGGYPYSLSAIQNGILRGNQRPPFQIMKPFGLKDKRLPVALIKVEPLIHFALTNASRSSPALKCYSPSVIDAELRAAVKAFFLDGAIQLDMETNMVSLSQIMKWYSVDFGKNEGEMLRWLVNYLEPSKAECLLEALDDDKYKIVYQPYDWSPNL